MIREQTEQKKQNQTNNTDNLRQLATYLNSGKLQSAITELRRAKQSVNSVSLAVRNKLQSQIVAPVLQSVEQKPETIEKNILANEAVVRETKPIINEPRPYQNRPKFERTPFNNDRNLDYKPRVFNNQGATRFNNTNNGKPAGRPFENRPFPPRPFAPRPFPPRPFVKKDSFVEEIEIQSDRNDRTFGNKRKTHEPVGEKKPLSKKAQLKLGLIDDDVDDDGGRVGRRYKPKKREDIKPVQNIVIDRATITTDNLTVKILSEKIGKPVAEIVKKLFILGIMATINSRIDYDTAELVASELGITLEKKVQETYEQQVKSELEKNDEQDLENLEKRPPIVTVMGHVDHGKTSLLDAIRKTNVISTEAGGITQHIGAYTVLCKNSPITFIDTPGHAAFSAMRARGAQITDIAILVVAADDGVMPQTLEALSQIQQAKVPMIVAINKIDKPEAQRENVLRQLASNDVLAEEWGGQTICVDVSAKTGYGINKLLEMILLLSEVQDLKANPNRTAVGTIIEAKLDKGQGPVATVLVQNGTLKVGDSVVSGTAFGKIRAMLDENGKNIKVAGPSVPVAVLGLDNVPFAGDRLTVLDEKTVKLLSQERKNKIKTDKVQLHSAVSADDFFNKMKEGNLKTLNIIIKADVQGSAEALKQSVEVIKNEEAKVVCVHIGVGAIIENDIMLAQASNSIIIGFNVKTDNKAKELAEKSKVSIRNYKIIYECIDDLQNDINKMRTPKYQEIIIGHVKVVRVFKISSVGTIAGCVVADGKVQRNSKVKVLRGDKVVAETLVESLKIKKDEVKEAGVGFECGIKLKDFNDIQIDDIIEVSIDQQIN